MRVSLRSAAEVAAPDPPGCRCVALIRLMIRQIYGGWLGRLVNKLSKSRRSLLVEL